MPPKRRGSVSSSVVVTSASAPTPTKKSAPAASPAPAHHGDHYEFGGPYLGPAGIIVGLPLLTYAYAKYCGGPSGGAWPNVDLLSLTPASVWAGIQDTWSTEAFLIYTCYWLFQAVLYLVLPGARVPGITLSDGSRLLYPMNGLLSLVVVVATALGIHVAQPFGPRYTLLWLFDNFAQVVLSTIVFSFLLSFFLYWWSFQAPSSSSSATGSSKKKDASGKLLAEGVRNITLYDFFLGRELNPRVLSDQLDLKFFCELRPGLVQWLLIDLACAAKQMSLSNAPYPDPWMLLVVIAQGYYVLDSVMNEAAILTTMDITTDGFGFMLAFGDLAWVPGVYALQTRFLADKYSPLTTPYDYACFLGVVALGALGMYIFRASNSQKDQFKRDRTHPSVSGLATIPTARGTHLLAGGWWGVARHINYFGDWVMSVSWCLPTGFATPLTYFYPIYFAVLLIHRDMRDEEKCAEKYGASWTEYCKKVKYRIVPFVY
jgi:protein-S-isoprenylcysteine O-methyltransferase Ste14